MLAGKEAGTPEMREEPLAGRAFTGHRIHDHEGREIIVLGPEAIVHPCSHTRSTGLLTAGLEEGDSRVVIDGFAVDRADEADLVGDLLGPGQQFAQFHPALPGRFEGVLAGDDDKAILVGYHASDSLAAEHGLRHVLAESSGDLRLGIKQIEMRRAAGLEKEDDPLGTK